MTQPELDFTPAPKPGELFKYGSQNYRVYEKLYSGGITTSELIDMRLASPSHRISDSRAKLKAYGLDVVCEPLTSSNNIFTIQPLKAEAA